MSYRNLDAFTIKPKWPDGWKTGITSNNTDLLAVIDAYDGSDSTDIDAKLAVIVAAVANAKHPIFTAAQA
jgi:hypothetical protein